MKKLVSVLLALAMLATLSVPVLAEGQNTTVTTSVEPSYTVTIPADTAIPFNQVDTDFGAVTLTEANLEVDYGVKVAATAGALTNKADAQATIPYAINAGEAAFAGATFDAEGETQALTLHIDEAAWNAAKAGQYEAVVTFTVEYVRIGK